MSSRHPPASTLPMRTVLGNSEPLGRLMDRLRESNACLAAVRPLLPSGLLDEVRAGPLEGTAWNLLVSNSAAAAKLRQCLPALEQALLAQRHQTVSIKVKIVPRAAS